jgi:hypothetical protein
MFLVKKKLYLHVDNLCVSAQFRENPISFMIDVKRQNMSRKKSYFYHQILSFHTAQTTSRFFMERLCVVDY